jgi:hypothetical protein
MRVSRFPTSRVMPFLAGNRFTPAHRSMVSTRHRPTTVMMNRVGGAGGDGCFRGKLPPYRTCYVGCYWPMAEATAAAGHGRLLGSICRTLARMPLDICDNPTQASAATGVNLTRRTTGAALGRHQAPRHGQGINRGAGPAARRQSATERLNGIERLDAARASIAGRPGRLAGRSRPGASTGRWRHHRPPIATAAKGGATASSASTGRRRPPQAVDRHRGQAPHAGHRAGIERLDTASGIDRGAGGPAGLQAAQGKPL